MLERMHHLANNNENFAFETILASKTFAPWIAKLKEEKGSMISKPKQLHFLV